MASLEWHYGAEEDIEARILVALRGAGLNPEERLPPEDLAALDQFPTGCLRASRELLEVARIQAGERVLDIGAGLAGPARFIAATQGCQEACLDLSPDYWAGAALLNRLTGLHEQIEARVGWADAGSPTSEIGAESTTLHGPSHPRYHSP